MRIGGWIALASALAFAGPAWAQPSLPDSVHGVLDLRLAAADGEASFAAAGFGKGRYGGGGGRRAQAHVQVAEAALAWTPQLDWAWSAVVEVAAQPDISTAIDFTQAYLAFRPVPRSASHFQARLGYFYPPISLEHEGPAWSVTDTITPSAINSWVGEEVKVAGAEASVSRDVGGRSLAFTAAVFGADDTAGALLTYRGWALHDLKANARGAFALPPLSAFAARIQEDETYSAREVDGRPGYYVRAAWRSASGVTFDALHYDNRGDKVGVTKDRQWAWRTQFTEVGVSASPRPGARILVQALVGRTQMGHRTAQGLFADVVFRSAYGLVAQDIGRQTLTGRIDLFDVHDHSLTEIDNNDESGWALTAAWRRPLTDHADLRVEAQRTSSRRPSRGLAGVAALQRQITVQTAVRFSF